jgi:hypothetical protein
MARFVNGEAPDSAWYSAMSTLLWFTEIVRAIR